jgi:hypothetical protein
VTVVCGGGKRRLGGVDLLLQGHLKGGPQKFPPGLPHRFLRVVDQVSRPSGIHAVHDLLRQFINHLVQDPLELLGRDARQFVHNMRS